MFLSKLNMTMHSKIEFYFSKCFIEQIVYHKSNYYDK